MNWRYRTSERVSVGLRKTRGPRQKQGAPGLNRPRSRRPRVPSPQTRVSFPPLGGHPAGSFPPTFSAGTKTSSTETRDAPMQLRTRNLPSPRSPGAGRISLNETATTLSPDLATTGGGNHLSFLLKAVFDEGLSGTSRRFLGSMTGRGLILRSSVTCTCGSSWTAAPSLVDLISGRAFRAIGSRKRVYS